MRKLSKLFGYDRLILLAILSVSATLIVQKPNPFYLKMQQVALLLKQ